MEISTVVGIAVGGLVLSLAAAYVTNVYNSLVRLDNKADQAKQNIDVKLKQRHETLSKLVETVSGYLDHEAEILQELTEAREAAEQASNPNEEAAADQQVREAVSALNARAEEYPELQSASNVEQLQDEIAELEEEISDRREYYNDAATLYNTRISQFPHVLFASAMGYTDRELFEADASETTDVDVSAAFDGSASSDTTDAGTATE